MATQTTPVTVVSPLYWTVISAFWMAFLAIIGSNVVGDIVMPSKKPVIETWAYPIEVAEVAEEDAGGGGPAARPDIRPLLLTADADAGKAVFRKCQSCHTVEPGGKNGTGPNLHNILGAPIGDHNGFKASESLKAIGGTWDYVKIDDYIENPKRLAPKGTMSFVGLKKPAERANVIKYLMNYTENPPPVEVPEAAPAEAAPVEAPAAPAEAPAAAPTQQ
ncbi:MAG: cytochrome c family protein [Rhodospirillaceae bacterium]|nr:cytochrome c family protein [Rhodospirillaceae bacterium]